MNSQTSKVSKFLHACVSKIRGAPAAAAVLTTALLSVPVAWSDEAVHMAAAPLVNRVDMSKWLADGERGLWIQASNLRWFYAHFGSVCHGLSVTNELAFETGASGNISQRSSIVVPGRGRCVVRTFARSAGPPQGRTAHVEPQPQAQ